MNHEMKITQAVDIGWPALTNAGVRVGLGGQGPGF